MDEKLEVVMARAFIAKSNEYVMTRDLDDLEPKDREEFLNCFTAALSAIREAGWTVVQGWQPIETAPKDGTWFLANQDGETYPCQWHREEYDEGLPSEGWYDLFNESFEEPTEWMPTPNQPRALLTAAEVAG